ncbi:hypothetical protein SEMRO_227_G092230.1 [Seminavis robusta]|uniref:Uncharacterized protein n=1 Tax=Seminavis robusta TaxID=568900 RepID=A0A9N8DLL1_9STRA|nr:hypothetical protein SEMRO_227_G092230.1 [Seminavis robusta]|eukprot:Sro227_g092230.1 n/a (981) ;mRNA; r:28417-31801
MILDHDPLQQVTPPRRRVTQSPIFRTNDPSLLPGFEPPTPRSHISSGVPSAIRAQVHDVMAVLDSNTSSLQRSHDSTPLVAPWHSQPSASSSLSGSYQTGVEGSATGPSLLFSRGSTPSRQPSSSRRPVFGDGFDDVPIIPDCALAGPTGPIAIIHGIPPCGYSSQFLTTIVDKRELYGGTWQLTSRWHPYLRGYYDRQDRSMATSGKTYYVVDGWFDGLPCQRIVQSFAEGWAMQADVLNNGVSDAPTGFKELNSAKEYLQMIQTERPVDPRQRIPPSGAHAISERPTPSAPPEPARNPFSTPSTPMRSGSRQNNSEPMIEVTTADGQRFTVPASSINRSVGTFSRSRDNGSVTSLDSLWMSHIESQHHLKDALGAIVQGNRFTHDDRLRASTELPQLPVAPNATAIYQWKCGVENALTGDHWEADDIEIWEYSTTTTSNKDISKVMARLLVKATKQNRTITDLLQREHSLKRRGPELLQAVLDTFLPVTSDRVDDRFADVSTLVQEQREYCVSFLLRLRFFNRQYGAASGAILPETVLRGWFVAGTVRHGPYRSILSKCYTRLIRPGGKLAGTPTLDCTIDQLAEHFDNILTGAENSKYYCDSKLLTGESPIRAYTTASRGKAHQASSVRAGSPGEPRGVAFQTSLDPADPMAIVNALKPFEDVEVTKEQAQNVLYHFACPWCVIARHKNPHRHHMSTCEHCIPGYRIEFDGNSYKEGKANRPRKPRNNDTGTAHAVSHTFPADDDDSSTGSGCESPSIDVSTIVAPINSPPVTFPNRELTPNLGAKLATIPEESTLDEDDDTVTQASTLSYMLNSNDNDQPCNPLVYSCNYVRKGPIVGPARAYIAIKPLPRHFVVDSANRATCTQTNTLACVDSGATGDMSPYLEDFVAYTPLEGHYIRVANGSPIPIAGYGTTTLKSATSSACQHHQQPRSTSTTKWYTAIPTDSPQLERLSESIGDSNQHRHDTTWNRLTKLKS